LEAKQILEGVVSSLQPTSLSPESSQEAAHFRRGYLAETAAAPVVDEEFTSSNVVESIAKKETSPQFGRLTELDLTQLPIFEEYK
jgi:hypothetical protein